MHESGTDTRSLSTADAYESMLKPALLPGVGKMKGYRGSYLLRRAAGDEVEFTTIMFWDTLDDIRAVAGPDCKNGCHPRGAAEYLSRYDSTAAHYDIVSTHQPDGASGIVAW